MEETGVVCIYLNHGNLQAYSHYLAASVSGCDRLKLRLILGYFSRTVCVSRFSSKDIFSTCLVTHYF